MSRNTTPRHVVHLAEIHAWVLTEYAGNVKETLNTSNGVNWWRGETSSYPPFVSTSNAVQAVRCFVTPQTATGNP